MVFLGVVAGGFVASDGKDTVYNNGTHGFNPTVIFISLDGVVNHDLHLSITPHISQLAKDGVQARWMTPSFPPITFPNHWSLVTGLYPETHGIVGNYFYAPEFNDTFDYKSPAKSWDGKWWGGEPIWITAEKQNLKSGVIMWPGCSSLLHGLRPTFEVPYSDYMSFDTKVDTTLDWLDLPLSERPQFVSLYVPNVDQAGHRYGPYANEASTMKQLQIADASIGRLLAGLERRNLTEIVHVMVVSDHGMSQTDKSRLIYYDDVLTEEEISLIWRIEAYPSLAIRPPLNVDQDEATETLYRAFKRLKEHQEDLNGGKAHFEVYKKEDIPERYHFRHHTRIPPLLVLPDPGWVLVTHKDYDSEKDGEYSPQGVHGYDNLSPHSRAIFVGRGPLLEKGRAKPFWNVELYEVVTRILDIQPSFNNGSLSGVLELE
ncbi:alkaline-phosphatase-like protein [Phycomyces nitens]|nr:alkaline-phosphatase-like protein [Phycomyces nitens]